MKAKIQVMMLWIISLFSTAGLAAINALEDWSFKPNIGVDVNAHRQTFDQGFGKEQFSKHYPDTNFYLGIIMYKYLGLEGGYEHMYRQEKKQFYNDGATVLGFLNPASPFPSLYLSEAFAQGWHLNLLGFVPICTPRTQLTASVGVAWLRMHFNTVAITDPAFIATPVVRWQSDRRAVARLGIGLRQMISDNFGARFQVLWENTRKLEATVNVPDPLGVATPTTPADNNTVRPKNSFTVGIGLFFQLL